MVIFAEYTEYVLKTCAVLTILWSLLNFVTIMVSTRPGLAVFFLGFLVAITAIGSGTTLLAVSFLFPGAVSFSGYMDPLWQVGSASLGSVILIDILLEGPLLAFLKRMGLELPRIWMIEAVLSGVSLGLALIVAARFVPDAELSPVAALAAGLISAFVRYYLGLWIGEMDLEDRLVAALEGNRDAGDQ